MLLLDTGPALFWRRPPWKHIVILLLCLPTVLTEPDGFSTDASVLATFGDHYDGREVELEKMVIFFF